MDEFVNSLRNFVHRLLGFGMFGPHPEHPRFTDDEAEALLTGALPYLGNTFLDDMYLARFVPIVKIISQCCSLGQLQQAIREGSNYALACLIAAYPQWFDVLLTKELTRGNLPDSGNPRTTEMYARFAAMLATAQTCEGMTAAQRDVADATMPLANRYRTAFALWFIDERPNAVTRQCLNLLDPRRRAQASV